MDKSDADVIAAIEDGAPTYETLDWDDERLAAFQFHYERAFEDALYIQPDPPRPSVSLPIGREAWLQCDPDSHEVVGARIEDFEDFFLPRHPEFREGWERVVKPHVVGVRPASEEDIASYALALLRQILQWFQEDERAFAAPSAPRRGAKSGA